MQIQKVQSNQKTFGTKVNIDAYTARILSLSKAKNKILKEAEQLESNGADDVLSLSLAYKRNKFYLNASVYEKRNNDCKISFAQIEPVETIVKNGKKKYVSIIQLYNRARKNLSEIVINKKSFEKFIPYIE